MKLTLEGTPEEIKEALMQLADRPKMKVGDAVIYEYNPENVSPNDHVTFTYGDTQ